MKRFGGTMLCIGLSLGVFFLVLCKAARYFQVHLVNLLILAWYQGTFPLS